MNPASCQLTAGIVAISAAMLALSGTSCSIAPPAIMSVGARLIIQATDATGGRDERLSVFVSVADGDGVDDIEYLYIVHDGEELCWTLTPDDWHRSDEGSSVWIGSNGLDAPGPAVPRGEYRIILVDRAGERAESTFSLSAPVTGAYRLPTIRLTDTSIELESPCPTNTAFFLDSGGNTVWTSPISKGTNSLDSLWPDGAWRSGSDFLAVYGLDPKAETGCFSWKIRLPD